ncbi:cytochrome b [Bordetella sp. FB-8]|uniref:cytochrome b n=1 Tax=Bordetella sp. FB-8 TaxID=1159870 RepID=UPI0003778CF7|nr:cytochrome b/b6 domain-containing protein [Bordetella sp. FB-8]
MNTGQSSSYDRPTIALHWLTAALVLFQFTLAMIWDFFPKPEQHTMIVTHTSFGIVLAVVLLARLLWRTTAGRRLEHGSSLPDLAARAAHLILYLLLVAVVVLGVMLRWSGHNPLSFFGLTIASPFGPFSHATHEILGNLHDFAAWSIIVIAVVHACAALFHHYVLRDGILQRMLPGLASPERRRTLGTGQRE